MLRNWLLIVFAGLLTFALACVTALATPASSNTVLLYSNSPEKVTKPTLLYQADTTESARLLLHHVNKSGQTMILEITLQNLDRQTGGFAWRLYHYLHTDPTQAGHYAVKQFWNDTVPIRPDSPLSPYEQRVIASIPWPNGQTISGIAWLYLSQTTRISVIARRPDELLPTDAIPASDVVFPLADITDEIPFTVPRNPVVFSIGRGNFLDNDNRLLPGNYGVLYHYRIIAANPTDKEQILRISTRQAGGVARAFVKLDNELLPIPTSANYEKRLLASRVLPPHSEIVIDLSTMPQPGSNMPIDFILESN